MQDSDLIKKIKNRICFVKGRKLTPLERGLQAVSMASLLLEESLRIETRKERKRRKRLNKVLKAKNGKAFAIAVTDQCFRSHSSFRLVQQLKQMVEKFGVPSFLPTLVSIGLQLSIKIGRIFAPLIAFVTTWLIKKESSHIIFSSEESKLIPHLKKRKKQGVQINVNYLGEAILGEREAERRLKIYLDLLAQPEINYISVKISSLYSQIHLLAWNDVLDVLSEKLRSLYRASIANPYKKSDGTLTPKFVNLDMEEYKDLALTLTLFEKVLDEPEFYSYEAGIVLQSYIPDSFFYQQKLTAWALERKSRGGASIKIRLVKGANLAMEQIESAIQRWPQTPYTSKNEVDANFKQMMIYGCQKTHAEAVHIGIGSHNLFDIAYALLLRSENEVDDYVIFEMLEGMADHTRRVIQNITGSILLYCPITSKTAFQNSIAYLIRRLDENTASENFLRQAFDLIPGTSNWKKQADLFIASCLQIEEISNVPRRTQNRLSECSDPSTISKKFENEPDTDWSMMQNRLWIHQILEKWKAKKGLNIPLLISGRPINAEQTGKGRDPSYPEAILYTYGLMSEEQVDELMTETQQAQKIWSQTSVGDRCQLLLGLAKILREERGHLIGVMVANTGKPVYEADSEVSEAIDFVEYYRKNTQEWHDLSDIEWCAKGTVLVASPWNFPCSISTGGIVAGLVTGNCVIFKPAPEAILVGWELIQLFWRAGFSSQVLQFLTCLEDPVGTKVLRDSRISAIILTGATETAEFFLRQRLGLDLIAETGGKNTFVISATCDRDLAIKDLVRSAFGYAGQKCSACSLAILEAEVYDDLEFLEQLRDAAKSLFIGSAWDLKTKVNPLMRSPGQTLLQELTELESGQEWLLKPKLMDPNHLNLWSPGIKLGVRPKHVAFQCELFGPVLSLVRAKNLKEAFELMNQTRYGLTAGLHSLNEEEQKLWLEEIEAGNCYINRTITGAIVERQPFGGCKASNFGKGMKAGGPNYITQLMHAKQVQLPDEKDRLDEPLIVFSKTVEYLFDEEEKEIWEASLNSYSFYWNHYFSKEHDPSLVRGQDNLLRYVPHKQLVLRPQKSDSLLDLLRVVVGAMIVGINLEISLEKGLKNEWTSWKLPFLLIEESNERFSKRILEKKIKRIRVISELPESIEESISAASCQVNRGIVLANGRLELLHFLRELSISRDYHRYGNLGEREEEKREPLPTG